MAFPDIPTTAGSRVLTAVQADGTATRTFPSLSSLTKNVGDLLIAIVFGYQSSSPPSPVFSSWGAGFTSFLDSASSGLMCVGAAYKFSTGSETGTFTVTQGGTITGHAALILMAITGAHSSAPPEGGSVARATTSAADPAAFNPSWGAEDTLWIAARGSGEQATTGSYTGLSTPPTNYSGSVQTGISGDVVGGVEGGTSFRQLNTASEDVGPGSCDTSNARNLAAVIAIRPAAPAPVPRAGFVGFQDPGVL